jgi:uncharacterized Fe-S cluster-containing protein
MKNDGKFTISVFVDGVYKNQTRINQHTSLEDIAREIAFITEDKKLEVGFSYRDPTTGGKMTHMNFDMVQVIRDGIMNYDATLRE